MNKDLQERKEEIKRNIMGQLWDICCHSITEDEACEEAKRYRGYLMDTNPEDEILEEAFDEACLCLEINA